MNPIKKFNKKQIANITNEILTEYYGEDITLPIDIEGLMEKHFDLKPVFQKNLERSGTGEAFITIGAQQIVIDEDLYMKESRRSRLNFSLAHEIGHFVLHKDYFQEIEILDEYISKIQNIDDDTFARIEREANIFAGHLLLPQSLIETEISQQKKDINLWEISDTAFLVKELAEKSLCNKTTVSIQIKDSISKLPENVQKHLDIIIDMGIKR